MSLVDYRTLFEHVPHLALRYHPGDPRMPWHLLDQPSGQLYARASTLAQAESFMRASERKGDATVEWASVEGLRRLEGALRVSSSLFEGSGEGPQAGIGPKPDHAAAVSQTGQSESAPSPDTFSRRVEGVVLPFAPKEARA